MFLYLLMRDEVVPGAVEGICVRVERWQEQGIRAAELTNDGLGQYAEEVAARLRNPTEEETQVGA